MPRIDVRSLLGRSSKASPTCREPDSMRPEMERGLVMEERKMSFMVRRKGEWIEELRLCGSEDSSADRNVGFVFEEAEGGYQDKTLGSVGGLTIFSPVKPEQGTNDKFRAWNPAAVRKAESCVDISVNRS